MNRVFMCSMSGPCTPDPPPEHETRVHKGGTGTGKVTDHMLAPHSLPQTPTLTHHIICRPTQHSGAQDIQKQALLVLLYFSFFPAVLGRLRGQTRI